MNEIYIGLTSSIPVEGMMGLFITDEVPKIPDKYRAQVFDPTKHHLDPFTNIDHIKAKDHARALYSIEPDVGANTLTVRNGKRRLARYLLHENQRLDKLQQFL